MDLLSALDFDADFGYEESAAGILAPLRLIHEGRSVEGCGIISDPYGLARQEALNGSRQSGGHGRPIWFAQNLVTYHHLMKDRDGEKRTPSIQI